MSDSARQPAVEMFVIVAPPSTSPEENPRVQRNSTRRAFLIFRSLSVLMVWATVLGGGYPSVVVLAPWVMGVRLRRRGRHELLSGQDDVARFALLGQVFRNFRMVGSHIADEPTEESL
jgi:hypothetical protein